MVFIEVHVEVHEVLVEFIVGYHQQEVDHLAGKKDAAYE